MRAVRVQNTFPMHVFELGIDARQRALTLTRVDARSLNVPLATCWPTWLNVFLPDELVIQTHHCTDAASGWRCLFVSLTNPVVVLMHCLQSGVPCLLSTVRVEPS
jgi:hypothetical protein